MAIGSSDRSTDVLREQLEQLLAELRSCVVAFSGGVDSAVVAKAAQLALGDKALAVTGVSVSLAAGELEQAERIAQGIGIRHRVASTAEATKGEYLANQPDRCWHCKDELYSELNKIAVECDARWIVNGANADDTHDFRPGMAAATSHQVRSPLAECGFNKATVRQLARSWGLEVWNKPATPCLSSRVVYGLEITAERLARIDAAERVLREQGFSTVRVRYHHDDLARVEVPLGELSRLAEEQVRREIVSRFRELGFRYVTLDLEGFRSGSFQQLVPLEELGKYQAE